MIKFPTCFLKYGFVIYSCSYFCLYHLHFSNVSTDTILALKDKTLNENFTELFKISNHWNVCKSHVTKLKSTNKIPFIWQKNTYVVSKGYNQINLWLSYDKIMFLNHQNVPQVANTCSYYKESGFCWLRLSIKITLKSLLLLAYIKSSNLDKWLQN